MNQTSLNSAPPLIIPPVKLLTTAEVAERLGVHRTRVHALIVAGRLPAQKFGPIYMIKESDVKLVEERKPGRPPKKSPKR
jgi:excisionase family DNA binding protein